MTATLMAGGPLAERIRAEVAQEVRELGGIGLATVQVGEDPASTVYIRRKHEAAGEAVIASTDLKLPEDITEEELVAAVELLNADDSIDGDPRPAAAAAAISTRRRPCCAIDPVKDVDGFHPFNAGQLYLGRPTLVPATPLGIMALLAEYRIALDGARAVVDRAQRHRRQADRAPAAAGERDGHDLPLAHRRPRAAHARRRRAGRRGGRARDRLAGHGQVGRGGRGRRHQPHRGRPRRRRRSRRGRTSRRFLTPVPGGVGPMTIAMLLRNTVRGRARTARRRLLAFPETPDAKVRAASQ